MKIKVTHTFKSFPSTIIIPIRSGKGINKSFNLLTELFGVHKSYLKHNFKALFGQSLSFSFSKKTSVILLGLGNDLSYNNVRRAFRLLSHNQKNILSADIAIDQLTGNLPLGSSSQANIAEASVAGLRLGVYSIGHYKTGKTQRHPLSSEKAQIQIITAQSAAKLCREAAIKGSHYGGAMPGIYQLVNGPGNKSTPAALAEHARASGKKHGFSVKVFDKAKIEKEELGALIAVNKGSELPPVFIIMEYKPQNVGGNDLKTVGLVGKGVTFDTGGLSIKGSNNMHYMKSDMGGAAAVLGAMEMTARLQLPVHLIGIIPATDNCVDAKSVRPGDVINSYSGKTIEIIDTDAEGRLILADGLAYMIKNYNPEIIIDLATLTGSCVQTLGYEMGGLFTNNQKLANRLKTAGEKVGEQVWQLPLSDSFANDIVSDVADVKNFSGRPIGGAIVAAKFLEFFTENHKAWAHLDIAGVAFGDNPFSKYKSATGYGVNLIVEFLRKC
ncbi:MAG: leucyl aminopeptidase family protein [Bacteroidota bacterium]